MIQISWIKLNITEKKHGILSFPNIKYLYSRVITNYFIDRKTFFCAWRSFFYSTNTDYFNRALFSRIPLIRNCRLEPIWFSLRSSVVSVCKKIVRSSLSEDQISSLLIKRHLIEKKGKECKLMCVKTVFYQMRTAYAAKGDDNVCFSTSWNYSSISIKRIILCFWRRIISYSY